MRKLFIFVATVGVVFLIGIKFSAAQGGLCFDPKGHLIWPSPQTANTIPMRSAGTADTLTNSPLSVNGGTVGVNSNLGISGNLTATGNITGANLCLGVNCVNNWSQVSGPWTQIANNLYPTNTSTNVGIGRNDPQYKLDVNGTFRVMVNGEERFAIRENPPTASTRNPLLAQVKPAQAQTTPTDRWIQLFGGAAYFLKRGTNSDVFLQVGDANTQASQTIVKGQQPAFFVKDSDNNILGKIWYSQQNNSLIIQYHNKSNTPITQLELTNQGLRLWKDNKLLYEVGEE